MSVNFNIIENPDPPYMEKYEEFIELYNNSEVTISKICEKLKWNVKVYYNAKKRALSEGRIIDNPPKYYYFRNGRYVVSKLLNGKRVYFGAFKYEDDAKIIVEELGKNEWDKESIHQLKKELMKR